MLRFSELMPACLVDRLRFHSHVFAFVLILLGHNSISLVRNFGDFVAILLSRFILNVFRLYSEKPRFVDKQLVRCLRISSTTYCYCGLFFNLRLGDASLRAELVLQGMFCAGLLRQWSFPEHGVVCDWVSGDRCLSSSVLVYE